MLKEKYYSILEKKYNISSSKRYNRKFMKNTMKMIKSNVRFNRTNRINVIK